MPRFASCFVVALSIAVFSQIAGCEPPSAQSQKKSGPSAPPVPPAAPGEIVTVTQEGSATVVRKKAKGPNYSLQDAKGNYPVIIVFSDSPSDKGYQAFRADWQAAQEMVKAKNLRLIEVFGVGEVKTARIEGGEALNFLAVAELQDAFGPRSGVTSVFVVGKDGQMIVEKRGGFKLLEALDKLD